MLKVIHPSGGVCRARRFLTIKTFHTHTLLQCLWRNNLPRANKSHNAREERVVIHTSDGDTCMGYINPKCQTIAGCRHENQALFPAPSHPTRDRKLKEGVNLHLHPPFSPSFHSLSLSLAGRQIKTDRFEWNEMMRLP